MNDEEQNALAKDAYQAYGRVTGNKNYQGLPMPEWLDLTPTIRMAWIVSSQAVAQAERKSCLSVCRKLADQNGRAEDCALALESDDPSTWIPAF